jgi:hypothetical protein
MSAEGIMQFYRAVRLSSLVSLAAFSLVIAMSEGRAQPFVDVMQKECAKEIKTHCSKVTPGNGRIALCLLSYENKLSARCDNAVFYAASELGKLLTARAAVVSVCEPDARRLCGGMQVGGGNVLSCLNLAQKVVSANCNKAIVDAGLR